MDYKEKSAYVLPDGIAYTNPKTGEKILLQSNQDIPEGFVKKGGRKTRRKSIRKSTKKSLLKFRKVR
jgi:hypothetical protein